VSNPYHDEFGRTDRIPTTGRERNAVLETMRALHDREQARWSDGFASGSVYHGDPEHIAFLSDVYALHSQTNPLHADLWPSISKFDGEICRMTAAMLHGADDVVGTVSSGGTESIMLAMKAYRDRGYTTGINDPEMIVPTTAHAAFDKASQYFRIRKVAIPTAADGRADVEATRAAITPSTVVVVGSAPNYPNGMVDPIEGLAAAAVERGVGMHVDACLGGFVLPWAERLGHPVPPFDFRVAGVTSMSADTHKYGYAAKGTSVVLYRGNELRHFQYYTCATWAGGLYYSPTFAGSRPGALIAQCWAAMVTMGEDGYLDATRRILGTAAAIKEAVRAIDGLEVIGDPLFDIAWRSDEVNIWGVLDEMSNRGWSLNGLQDPPAMHLCVTLRHCQAGVVERFAADLAASVQHLREHPDAGHDLAPVYGMAQMTEMQGMVEAGIADYVDKLYE
jgi:glutamate/tyrosine decarboxylase-like PLP-dependent enzyme